MLQQITNFIRNNVKITIYGLIGTALGFYVVDGFNSIFNFFFCLIGSIVALFISATSMEEIISVFAYKSGKSVFESRTSFFSDVGIRFVTYFLYICVLYSICAFSVAVVSSG